MNNSDHRSKAIAIKQQYEKKWLDIKGVVAVGIGLVNERMGIIVSVEGNIDSVRVKIPKFVEGIPTHVQRTGTLKAQHD